MKRLFKRILCSIFYVLSIQSLKNIHEIKISELWLIIFAEPCPADVTFFSCSCTYCNNHSKILRIWFERDIVVIAKCSAFTGIFSHFLLLSQRRKLEAEYCADWTLLPDQHFWIPYRLNFWIFQEIYGDITKK